MKGVRGGIILERVVFAVIMDSSHGTPRAFDTVTRDAPSIHRGGKASLADPSSRLESDVLGPQ